MEIVRAVENYQKAGAFSVRIEGMNRAFNISLKEEFDNHDFTDANHIIALDKTYPVGTLRFYEIDKRVATIGRVVVLPEYRKKHIGASMIAEAEKWIKELGYDTILVDSRVEAVGFYQKLGFNIKNDEVKKKDMFNCILMEKRV